MSLSAGRKLAHYEIVEPIGKGGMGEVYRARDGKLGRDVAVKVLPEEFSRDRERLDRFQREARLLAQLNHSNVATLYGLEEHDGQQFLVMELVEGETLAERIARGRIPVDEAIPLFLQIAEGLEAAHEKGIIHRDLKPANIKLTPDDEIKILDFGLAKAFADQIPDADSSMSPTITRNATRAGVILGTAAYMSPEQAKGKSVDKRSDIWSFGVVLYEALSGKRLFTGETVSDVLAAVLTREVDFAALPGATPPYLRRLLQRCLERDPKRRLRDIGEARIGLEAALAGGTAPPSVERGASALPWAVAALFAVALVASWFTRGASGPSMKTVTRFTVSPTMGEQLTSETGYPLAVSPDGSGLAYVARRDDGIQLYVRRFDRQTSEPLDGTDGAMLPFYSPDGQWVGYFARGKLWKVRIEGGVPVALADATEGVGAAWGEDDNIYFSPRSTSGVMRIPASGGASEALTVPERKGGAISHRVVSVLPGARALIFRAVPGGLTLLRLGGSGEALTGQALTDRRGDVPELLPGVDGAAYVASGHLVFIRADTLMAVPFDLDRLEILGDPIAMAENAEGAFRTGGGHLAYVPFGSKFSLVEVERNGNAQAITQERHPYEDLSVSPDGRYVASTLFYVPMHIWILDRERETMSRMSALSPTFDPLWTPDGSRICFTSMDSMYCLAADGSGEAEEILTADETMIPGSFTPDGKHLAYTGFDDAFGRDLWILSLEADGATTRLIQTRSDEWSARFSPDGRWLAYVSNETGRGEIYLQAYPGPGARQQISSEGGDQPMWAPSGGELFYLSGDRMMVVDVTTEPSLNVGKPRLLFERPFLESFRGYEVTADGERFIAIERDAEAVWQIQVVLSWSEELKRLVPTDN